MVLIKLIEFPVVFEDAHISVAVMLLWRKTTFLSHWTCVPLWLPLAVSNIHTQFKTLEQEFFCKMRWLFFFFLTYLVLQTLLIGFVFLFVGGCYFFVIVKMCSSILRFLFPAMIYKFWQNLWHGYELFWYCLTICLNYYKAHWCADVMQEF